MSVDLLYDILCAVLALLLVGFGLTWAVHRLARSRPGFCIGKQLAAAVALRLVAIIGISLSGIGRSLRGPDELQFLIDARLIAASGFDSELWIPAQFHRLHEIIFALQIKFGDFPEVAMRITQIGLAVLGLALIAAAIYDLAGPRAATIAAWIFAVEPGSIFYNGLLHREPLLVLVSGLVVFGGAKIWIKLELRGVLMYGLGCVFAVSTRPYAGWFLITAGLLLILHASLRQFTTRLRSIPLIYAVAIVVAATTPAVLRLTSESRLESSLQVSQNSNTDPTTARGAAATNNLSLESVDFSSRSSLIVNLPRRVRDIILRPYPWQLQNTSQQLGALGTLIVLSALFLLARYVRRNRGQVLALAAPIIYPAFFLMIGYSLAVGNAGTGFRYRSHLVLLGLATLVVLREHALRKEDPVRERAAEDDLGTAVGETGISPGRKALLT